jgi:hypothetical protein
MQRPAAARALLALLLLLPASRAFPLDAPRKPSGETFQLAQASPDAAPAKVFAFAKASPLQVSDSTAVTETHPQEFEFGKAYEATEEPPGYLKVKLRDDKIVYVRSTYVTTLRTPQWLATTSGYNRPERAHIQFWESGNKLNEFLSGANRTASQCDYEEYFDAAPGFQLKLPIVERDSVDLLSRQIKFMSVMLPISRQMYLAFEEAKTHSERPIDLDFVVDVSGSTNGFLERAVGGIAKAVNRSEPVRKRLRSTVVTTFGATRTNKSAFIGKVSLSDFEKRVWHPQGVDQTTDGEREPLLDGLVTLNESLKADDAATQVLVILSGADVESATSSAAARAANIGNFELSLHKQPTAIFAQVTPEPSDDLRNASRQLRMSRVRYIDYQDNVGDDIVSELIRISENQKTAQLDVRSFAPVVAAGNDKRMMTFLPRVLTPTSSLPARPAFAAESDWYAIRLWLTVDELIWKETAQ